MSWPRFSLQNRYTVFAALIAVIIFGISARLNFPVQLFPDTDPPVITIVTPYPGAAAEDVAKNLSKPLEEAFAGIDGVARITSTSQSGLSVVKVEFHYNRKTGEAAVDVQNEISGARYLLPPAIGEPRVMQFSSSDKPIITIAMDSEILPLDEVRDLADNAFRDRLQLVEGVAAVDVFGGHRKELEVSVHRSRLEQLGITLEQIERALSGWNVSESGGRISPDRREAVIRFDMPLGQTGTIENLPVSRNGDRVVRIGDLAAVKIGTKEARSAFRFNGQTAIALRILKRDEANTVILSRKIRDVLAELAEDYPHIRFRVADDDSVFTERVIDNMTGSVFIAIVMTVIVVFLFLADLRQAAIISSSIPVAFLMTFWLMQLAGVELNMVTMSAIILSIGLLVDDGIVVLENIERHLYAKDKTPLRAAIEGAEEIFLADLAGTATTIAVLVPLAFMGGFVGRLFSPLAWTLIFALSASFIVSVTLIPLLCAYGLSHGKATAKRRHRWLRYFNDGLERLGSGYAELLKHAMRRPLTTMGIALLLMIGSFILMRQLGSEMLPRFDPAQFQVSLDVIPGLPLEETLKAVEAAERHLLLEPEVLSVSTQIGYETGGHYLGERGAMDVNQARLTVNLTQRTQRAENIWNIMDRADSALHKIPGIFLCVIKEKGGTARSTTAAPVDVRISGPDPVLLSDLGDEILSRLRLIPGFRALYRSWSMDMPELKIAIDHERAAELGLNGREIARTVYRSIEGQTVTPYRRIDRRDFDILMRYAENDRTNLSDLEDVYLAGPRGMKAPLREVIRMEKRFGPRIVTREDFNRTIDILGYHGGRALSEVAGEVQQVLDELVLPLDYSAVITGEQRDFGESRRRILGAMMSGLTAVYLLLAAQFRSFKHPLTIMAAIPLQFIGVATALLVTGKYLSMPALLGIILLIGTVVNNSIVLIDYVLQRRRQGMDLEEAIAESVKIRFRPIMMTATSDVAGMLPLAMELAVGAERFSPIAIVVIGGIIAATFLTLVFIPVLYLLLERFGKRIGERWGLESEIFREAEGVNE